MDKKSCSVHAVNEEADNGQPDQQDVMAFWLQQRQQNHGFQSNSNRGNNQSRGQNNRSNYNSNRQNYSQNNQPKSNASRNGKFRVYCKIINQTQEECRKPINDNKPCFTSKGQLYWPKVNSTNDNPNTVQQNSNPSAIESVFC
jgi:hypothetical protein